MNKFDEALKGFRPEFGNSQHRSIIDRIEKVNKMRVHIKNQNAKIRAVKTAVKTRSKVARDLAILEAGLVSELEAFKK